MMASFTCRQIGRLPRLLGSKIIIGSSTTGAFTVGASIEALPTGSPVPGVVLNVCIRKLMLCGVSSNCACISMKKTPFGRRKTRDKQGDATVSDTKISSRRHTAYKYACFFFFCILDKSLLSRLQACPLTILPGSIECRMMMGTPPPLWQMQKTWFRRSLMKWCFKKTWTWRLRRLRPLKSINSANSMW
ncbi:hypothetical protein BC940DRAFT_118382 [Gongronella butleri]|nr:hypothetical protein BC940DRAFT_118382 [Gongronella butleri]